jgi:hypothetical protein
MEAPWNGLGFSPLASTASSYFARRRVTILPGSYVAAVTTMAKLTRSHSLNALVAGVPTFGAAPGRFSIGITSRETGTTYHLHLTDDEARRFAAFVTERGDGKARA